MALRHSPKIITDGLILAADPSNPRCTFPGTSSYDVKNLINVDGFDGQIAKTSPSAMIQAASPNAFRFVGTNTRINFYKGDFSAWYTGLASLFAFIKSDGAESSQDAYAGIMFNRGSGSNISGLSVNGQNGNVTYTWYNASNTYTTNTSLSIPADTYCMVGMSVDSSKADVYVNLSKFTNSVTHSASMEWTSLNLGRDSYNERCFNGDMGIALMYNRYLTESEVKHNYNALKGRFGL